MADLEDALSALRAGRPVVVPTDTVYGLAVMPRVTGAVDAVFEVKRRPREKPLPVLASSATDLIEVAVLDRRAVRLAELFWPGPLTLVLPRASSFVYDLGGEKEEQPYGDGSAGSVAVRVPDCEATIELLRNSGPLAVTSANPSGCPPARTVAEARAIFGSAIEVYVEGGQCAGSPSTIISLTGPPAVLRSGALPGEDVLATLTRE